MAESLICETETSKSSSSSSLFHRRIEFHPARKPFTGFTNGSSDFHLECLNPNASTDRSTQRLTTAAASSGVGKKKSDGGDFLEYGLDPELSFGITFRRIGAGLENLGNTCFLNSVLQCLTYTEPFAAYLQSGKHKSSCRTAGFCALCAIQNHVKRALQATGRILAPKDLVMNLRCISRSFRNARQEDAHEYMVNLLESMHKCCLPSGVPSESSSAYDKSLVHKIFGGRLRSQVKCMQCSYCSNKFDPFLDLSLEIMKADSLRKALSHFTAPEQLDGGERQYQCERCKQKVRALKQLTVHKAPHVLTIHLKRFGSHIAGQKINKKVEFGPTLDLKPFVSGSYEGDLKYTLYGVLVHAGWSTHSGHYYCFVRTSSGMWHSLDDNRVVQVSERTVLEQKAYMLFYVRDRKNLALKKPIDMIPKEKAEPSMMGSKGQTAAAAGGLNKIVQNGSTARGLAECSPGAKQVNTSISSPLKKPQLKEASVVTTTKGLVIEAPTVVKNSPMVSSSKERLKGPVILPSTNGQVVGQGFPHPSPSSVKSTSPTAANGAAKSCLENGHQESGKDLSVSVSVPLAPPDCNGTQSLGHEQLVDKAIHKVGVVNKGMAADNDPRIEKAGSAGSSDRSGTGNKRKEETCPKQTHQKAAENGLSSKENGSMGASSQPRIGNGSIKKGTDHHENLQKLLKPKKKLMKNQMACIFIGSKLSFKASMRSCKKNKHRRDKRRNLQLKQYVQNLEEVSVTCGLEPSTSENTRMTAIVSKSHKKKSSNKHTKDVRDSNGESTMNATRVDSEKRVNQNDAVLATNGSPQKSSSLTLAVKQGDSKEQPGITQDKRDLLSNGALKQMGSKEQPGSSQVKKDLLSNGSISKKDLMQTTVACWDGVEGSRVSGSLGSNGTHTISIGYVPDEWDEEYDRGKRKKVRTKEDFGGPNLFQQVATKKLKSKNVKFDKTSSGNQPFRI